MPTSLRTKTQITDLGTTVVNAAFLQEVKDSNSELWNVLADLRRIQVVPTDESKECGNRLVLRLSDLRDCLGLQFSLEETYGFICSPSREMASTMQNAEQARQQHRELYLQLQEICEQAEEAQYRGTIVRDLPIFVGAFEQFDEQFAAHEELEAELIRSGLAIV